MELIERAVNTEPYSPDFPAGGNIFVDDEELRVALMAQSPYLRSHPAEARHAVTRLRQAAGDIPEINSYIRTDLGRAVNMATDDYAAYIAARNATDVPWQQRVFDAAAAEYLNRVGSVWRADQLLTQRTTWRGRWDDFTARGATIQPGIIAQALDDAGLPARDDAEIREWLGREGEWASDGSNLALRVGGELALVRLDEGTMIRSTLDAAIAYLKAQRGDAHAIDGTTEISGVPNALARTVDFVGGGLRFADRVPVISHTFAGLEWLRSEFGKGARWGLNAFSDLTRIPTGMEDPAHRENRLLTSYVENDPTLAALTPEGQLSAAVGMLLQGGYGVDDAVLAMQRLGQPDVLEIGDARHRLTEELIDEYRQDDDTGPVSEFVANTIVDPLVYTLEEWDAFTQFVGVQFFDTASDIRGGVNALAAGDATEAWERFSQIGDLSRAETISEELGIDGSWAFWVDLGGGALFDPVMWMTPGGRGGWKALEEALTNPALAHTVIAHPKYATAARTIGGGGTKARNTAYWLSQGLEGPWKRQLFHIARDTTTDPATKQRQVLKVLEEAVTDSAWLPAGPGRYTTRQIGFGFSNAVASWDKLPRRLREVVERYYVKAASRRSVTLGPNYLDETMDDLASLTNLLDGEDDFFRYVDRIIDADDEARGLIDGEAARVAQRRSELEDEIAAVYKGQGHDVAHVRRDSETLRHLNGVIERMGDDVDGALISYREDIQRRLDDALPSASDAQNQLRTLNEEMNKLTREAARLASPQRQEARVRVLAELYQDIGKRIGLKELDEPHPFLVGEKKLDWKPVTGERTAGSGDTKVLDSLAFAGGDTDLAGRVNALGMFTRRGYAAIPAAPLEILLYKHGARNALAKLHAAKAADAVAKGVDAVSSLFFFTVLTNPVTSGKITLDESWRFLIDTGRLGKFTQATAAGLPGMGAVGTDLRRTPGLRWLGSQLNPLGDDASTYMVAHARNTAQPNIIRARPFQMITKGTRGVHPRAAERFVNSHLLKDEAFLAWAQGRFDEWWDINQHLVRRTSIRVETAAEAGEGTFKVGSTVRALDRNNFGKIVSIDGASARVRFVSPEGGTATVSLPLSQLTSTRGGGLNVVRMDKDLARRTIEEGLEVFVAGADNPVAFRQALLDAAKRGEAIPWDKGKFWRQAPAVPGQILNPRRSPSGLMEAFFTAPQARRAGHFFKHYHELAHRILTKRFAGRVLNEETLMSRLGVDELTAAQMIAEGNHNPVVRDLIRSNSGGRLILQRDIDDQAMRWATRNSDRLMYQIGAVSVAGRGAARVYPFARAHVEFLDWWARRLFAPMEVGLNVPLQNLGRALPGRAGQAFQPGGLPVLSRPVVPSIAGRPIPLNLRLWAEMSHGAAAIERSTDQSEAGPASIVQGFTFLPGRFDDDFLTFIIPGLGPIPAWLIGYLDPDNPIRQFFTDLHPALEYIQGRTGVSDLPDMLVPATGRSVRSQIGSVAKLLFGENARKLGWLADADRRPYALSTFEADVLGDWLKDNHTEVINLDPAAPYMGAFADMSVEALDAATRREGTLGVARMNPAFDQLFNDYSHLRHLDGFVEMVDRFTEMGFVADSTRDEIHDAWRRFTEGTDDAETLRAVRDTLLDSLFNDLNTEAYVIARVGDQVHKSRASALDLLLVEHPQTGINLVGRTRCATDEHGQIIADEPDACVDGRLRFADLETQQRFWDNNWVEHIPFHEWGPEAHQRVNDAKRRYAADLFEMLLPRSEPFYDVNDEGRLLTPWDDTYRRKDFEEAVITIPTDHPLLGELEKVGVQLDAAAFSEGITGAQLREAFRDAREPLARDDVKRTNATRRVLTDSSLYMSNGVTNDNMFEITKGLFDLIDKWEKQYDAIGIESMDDWPEEAKEEIRRRFGLAIDAVPDFTITDYNRDYRWAFGDIDFIRDEVLPTSVDQLGKAISGSTSEVQLVDGDTVQIPTEDGLLRLRIIGINAPEKGDPRYQEGVDNLGALLEAGSEITFGLFKPELYGAVGRFFGESGVSYRVNVFMFVDGVPIYDPSVFTADNPRGVGVGGEPVDLVSILLAGKEAT